MELAPRINPENLRDDNEQDELQKEKDTKKKRSFREPELYVREAQLTEQEDKGWQRIDRVAESDAKPEVKEDETVKPDGIEEANSVVPDKKPAAMETEADEPSPEQVSVDEVPEAIENRKDDNPQEPEAIVHPQEVTEDSEAVKEVVEAVEVPTRFANTADTEKVEEIAQVTPEDTVTEPNTSDTDEELTIQHEPKLHEPAVTQTETDQVALAAHEMADVDTAEDMQETERTEAHVNPAWQEFGRLAAPRQYEKSEAVARTAQEIASGRSANQLSHDELLAAAETISVDAVPLRKLYEMHSLNEGSLRRLVAEYLRGHDIKETLAHELLEKELRFELDPSLHSQRDQLDAADPAADLKSSYPALFQTQAPNRGADGMTSEERAVAVYEQRLLHKSKQARRTLDYLLGTVILILVVIVLILLLRHA